MNLFKYIAAYYSKMFNISVDQYKTEKKYKKLAKSIKEANKKFLSSGFRHYVMPDPYSGGFFCASRKEILHLQQAGVFKQDMNIYQILKLALYVTPERLNQETLAEVKRADLHGIMKNILAKLKL